ncbi:acetyl-CoA C-acyltransferase [Borrelia sp. RT5S]|uniref:thiolase family protein n=1 Tax=Borrelia sp. RT5S TaxID=2898581 RepID=UPI001E2DA593|nr:acetyl-CoA C-acyltransferase [Borrelia sp. RT5S]UGQ15818.1 acetyl-CoA C-acyltransferase [Borrelia sp. RT5S]
MRRVAIVDGLRSPIFKLGGAMKGLDIVGISSDIVKALLGRNNIDEVDEVVVGSVISAGLGQNIARQIVLKAGLSENIPACTVNKVCGSGLKSLEFAFNAISLGNSDVVLAGGVEDLSNAPYLLPRGVRFDGLKFGDFKIEDSIYKDALVDTLSGTVMGLTAEYLAEMHEITREMQDEFAYNSHMKARAARDSGYFDDEIYPLSLVDKKTNSKSTISSDEEIRDNLTLDKLSALRPIFKEGGTITAGNSSSLNDGACFLILAGDDVMQKMGIEPLAYVGGFRSVGLSPLHMGFGAYLAIDEIIKKFSLIPSEIDFIETNEAFSAQALTVLKALYENYGTKDNIVNVKGGAIAIGHPFAVSGARILLTLARLMKINNKRKGIASLCVGGGQGIASYLYR